MSTEDDQTLALKVCREINGLRGNRSITSRLAEKEEYNIKIALERKEPIARSKKVLPTLPNDFFELEDYCAYDPITHHVLLNYKGTYRTLQEKYEWQPVLVLLLDYYAQGKFDLVKELETAVCTFKSEYLANPSAYIAKIEKGIWNLERKPITDFNCHFDKNEPFPGFIPSVYQGHNSIYKGHSMIVYSLKKKDGRNVFGLTDFASLEKALEKRGLTLVLKNLRAVAKKKETLFAGYTQEILHGNKSGLENLEKVLHIMGGEIRLSEPKEDYSVRADQLLYYLSDLEKLRLKSEAEESKTPIEVCKRKEQVSEEDYKKLGPKKAKFFS